MVFGVAEAILHANFKLAGKVMYGKWCRPLQQLLAKKKNNAHSQLFFRFLYWGDDKVIRFISSNKSIYLSEVGFSLLNFYHKIV